MNSMTGYGRGTAGLGNREVTVQVSSVNRKTLDLTVSLPDAWTALETAITERVRQTAARGKVHVDVELTGAAGGDDPGWDEAAAAQALDRLAAFADARGLLFQPTPEVLWQVVSAQRKSAPPPAAEEASAAVRSALGAALAGFGQMRAQEGRALQTDLLGRWEILARRVDEIAAQAPRVPAGYRELLLQRLRQAGLELDLNDERVLKELALFADRCDISEELTRLRSHLEQFGQLLHAEGEAGRKAEFILQEIGREIHTIGSKANDLAISRAVIEFKNELERVREQIANVE